MSDVVAVTGARGRLGGELMKELARRSVDARAWSRPEYDLDVPSSADVLLRRDQPSLVIHAAAWTDVDACAREPDLAIRRNGLAVGELARACAATETRMVLVSTNEVFDGRRADGQGYAEHDLTSPASRYGQSKVEGERLARAAFSAANRLELLWIVRTAWLYGPAGGDFPARIVAVADRLGPSEELRVVDDEIGSPTYAPDLAAALLEIVSRAPAGTYHLVNRGFVSRYGWAAAVLDACRPGRVRLTPISLADYRRDSTPPAWGVLATGAAEENGITLRDWRNALADELSARLAK